MGNMHQDTLESVWVFTRGSIRILFHRVDLTLKLAMPSYVFSIVLASIVQPDLLDIHTAYRQHAGLIYRKKTQLNARLSL